MMRKLKYGFKKMAIKKNNIWLTVAKNFVALVVLSGFLYYLWSHKEELKSAMDVSIRHIILMVLLILLSWYVSGLQSYLTYRAVNIPMTVMEGVMITIAGSFANHLPMRPGTIVGAYYLKARHGLKYANFGGIMGMRIFLTMIAAGLMGLTGILYIGITGDQEMQWGLVLVFFGIVCGPLFIMSLSIPGNDWMPEKMRKIVGGLFQAYDELRQRPKLVIYVIILLIIQYLILGLRFVVSADAVNADIPIEVLLMMSPLAALMSYAAITPGGLGLREALIGYVAMSLGYSFSDGLFVGTVDRAVLLVMIAIFGGASFMVIWKRCHG